MEATGAPGGRESTLVGAWTLDWERLHVCGSGGESWFSDSQTVSPKLLSVIIVVTYK